MSLSKYSKYYKDLNMKGKIIAEYIWIDKSGIDLRSKARILEGKSFSTAADLPMWNFDGSSTGQATTENSEVLIKP